jgi:hypothetical protein
MGRLKSFTPSCQRVYPRFPGPIICATLRAMIRTFLCLAFWAVLSISSCVAQQGLSESYLKMCREVQDSGRRKQLANFEAAPERMKGMSAANVAHTYFQPQCQVAPDYENARKYYALAVEHGDFTHQTRFNLAMMMFEGKGGPMDKNRAVALILMEDPIPSEMDYLEKNGFDVKAYRAKYQARMQQFFADNAKLKREEISKKRDLALILVGGLIFANILSPRSSASHEPDNLDSMGCQADMGAAIAASRVVPIVDGYPASCW